MTKKSKRKTGSEIQKNKATTGRIVLVGTYKGHYPALAKRLPTIITRLRPAQLRVCEAANDPDTNVIKDDRFLEAA